MASDDAVFGVLLVVSIPLGYLLRATSGGARELLGCSIGFIMACLVCRWHTIHFVLMMGVSIPLLLFVPRRHAPKILFAWCFGYLAFFRVCHYIGLPPPTGPSNAVQMMLTLKLVGLACELGETERWRLLGSQAPSEEDAADAEQQLELHGVQLVTARRIVSYSLCFVGLLAGPFYKYRTYADMLERDPRTAGGWRKPLLFRALVALPCGAVYLALSLIVRASYATDDDFYDQPAWWRHGYLMALFARYRARMYAAWLLSECACVAAALGAYPVEQRAKSGLGPTRSSTVVEHRKRSDVAGSSVGARAETDVDYETVRTIDPWTVETCATFKETLRAWNKTVQWWLAANVHSSVRVGNRAFRAGIVMLVSAFWHGIYPGYYATFLILPFCFVAEELVSRATRSQIKSPVALKAFDVGAAFLKMRYFEYISTGPLLLTLDASWRYWKSTYFVGHACVAAAALVGCCCLARSDSRGERGRAGPAKAS